MFMENFGSWNDGREKAPAALARKFMSQFIKKIKLKYGEMSQIRSFLYIDDCIRGTDLLFRSKFRDPINIGNDKHVSINQLVSILEKITNHKVKEFMTLPSQKGVNSRSSDNKLVKQVLNWYPYTSTEDGMKKLYKFIKNEYLRKINGVR